MKLNNKDECKKNILPDKQCQNYLQIRLVKIFYE